MDQVFHVECFTCIMCNNKLRGQPFYAVEKKAYCEPCYICSCAELLAKHAAILVSNRAESPGMGVFGFSRELSESDCPHRGEQQFYSPAGPLNQKLCLERYGPVLLCNELLACPSFLVGCYLDQLQSWCGVTNFTWLYWFTPGVCCAGSASSKSELCSPTRMMCCFDSPGSAQLPSPGGNGQDNTLEQCSVCAKPIMERILRATGKAYHPHCFTCVMCNRSLDGIPFTVDAGGNIHCIEDFHKKFAPRCSVCKEPIMPAPGQEETVRIVALDRDFHVQCYRCEDCGGLLSEGDNQGCYPLDGHILCKTCNSARIQALTAKASTDL
ncbi:hypothetical protein TURU_086594 [Turdus rufiventris]|nr:hypothetical protein TURU_086594 [Turdus rufiventris]